MSTPTPPQSDLFTPGWFEDPQNPRRQRFWSGTGWTDQSRVNRGFKKRTGPNRLVSFGKKLIVTAVVGAVLLGVVFLGMVAAGIEKDADLAKAGEAAPAEVVEETVVAPPVAVAPPAVAAPEPATVVPAAPPAPPPPPPAQALANDPVHPGAFCSDDGATGTSKAGKPMACTTTPDDDKLRWRSR